MNRLSGEHSPYLLQHAANPVDWFPWGAEAFAKARAEQKPIFLSIGYSTCHWCHVMAHESFEDPGAAEVLNAHFVAIKVDREERPDVDRVYMGYVQSTTGSGGWPMSVWLTPDLKPFYGGTYFPPSSKWGRPGFVEILREIARAWDADRDRVVRSAEAALAGLESNQRAQSASRVAGADALARAVGQFQAAFDPRHGGFGGSPKFPRPSELLFLLREYVRTGSEEARAMALATLRAMAVGGMRDHVGGGFHRYSVDAAWRVPHFEKMLYDQAQLVLAYAEGAQASGDPFYLAVAEDTLRYVMREMTDETGGFHSAEDADSVPPEHAGQGDAHKTEGAFYLWTVEEVERLLGDDAPVVIRQFGLRLEGNAPVDPHGEFTGKNLLYLAHSVEDTARDTGRTPDEAAAILDRAKLEMFRVRLDRPAPHRDDKILTAWNGLMIAAFARVARIAGGPYLDAARRAAVFVREHLWRSDTRTLLRRFRAGHADIDGYAEDYAYLVFGLLELFQADPDPAWLEWASELQRRQDELFWDDRDGGWFSTTGRDEAVLLRMKEDYDGAEPSASSISVMNLEVLSQLLADPGIPDQIERTFGLFGARLEQAARSVPMMAAALSAYLAGPQQVVIVGAGDAGALSREVVRHYLPFAITLVLPSEEARRSLATLLPLVAAMPPIEGSAAAYVCRNFVCRQPVTTIDALNEELLTL